jgi:hypothetical protein
MSSCPICKGRDGFPQTIQRERISTSGYYVSSRTESNQFVFCKECRVQFEPLTSWSLFEWEAEQQKINNMPPNEKTIYYAPLIISDCKFKRKLSWSLTVAMLLLFFMCGYLVFTVEDFFEYKTEFIVITGSYFVFFILYLRRNKRKMSDWIEMENQARRELGR